MNITLIKARICMGVFWSCTCSKLFITGKCSGKERSLCKVNVDRYMLWILKWLSFQQVVKSRALAILHPMNAVTFEGNNSVFVFGLLKPYIFNPIAVCVSEHLHPVISCLGTIRTVHNMCLLEWQLSNSLLELSNPLLEFTSLGFVGFWLLLTCWSFELWSFLSMGGTKWIRFVCSYIELNY